MDEDNRVEIVDSELDFYGDNIEGEKQVIEGISDTVTDYTFTNLQFPCVIFKQGFTTEKHRFTVIKNIITSPGADKDIGVYFYNKDNELLKVGQVSGLQISSLIEIAGIENLTAYYDDGSLLEGSLIYTLCSF